MRMSFWPFRSSVPLALKNKISYVLIINKHQGHLTLKSSSLMYSGKAFACNLCYTALGRSFLKEVGPSWRMLSPASDIGHNRSKQEVIQYGKCISSILPPRPSPKSISIFAHHYPVLVSKRESQKRIRRDLIWKTLPQMTKAHLKDNSPGLRQSSFTSAPPQIGKEINTQKPQPGLI